MDRDGWIRRTFRDDREGTRGKWLLYGTEEVILQLYSTVDELARTGTLDIPGMKRSTGVNKSSASTTDWVLVVYTDGEEKDKVAVGMVLRNLVAGTYKDKFIYWKSEVKSLRGTVATGQHFNTSDRIGVPSKPMKQARPSSSCDNCGRRTRNKADRLGRCQSCCVPDKFVCKSGTYAGKLYHEILSLPKEERVYGSMAQEEMELLQQVESVTCSSCLMLDLGMRVSCLSYCWRCFQCGHVKYSSGKYKDMPVVLALHRDSGYSGDDLLPIDVRLYLMGRRQLNEYNSHHANVCHAGPAKGKRWEEVGEAWREYVSTPYRGFESMVGYCATREHLDKGTEVTIDKPN